MKRLLILGGTGEASQLAIAAATIPNLEVRLSVAGRTSQAANQPGVTRVGDFGGVGGLIKYLQDNAIDILIDATHPFAAKISLHAAVAAKELGLPRLMLIRPEWKPQAGDNWIEVDSIKASAEILKQDLHTDKVTTVIATKGSNPKPNLATDNPITVIATKGSNPKSNLATDNPITVIATKGSNPKPKQQAKRVFLTVGRQQLANFAHLDNIWFLMRLIEPPKEDVLVPQGLVICDRGPFDVAKEKELLIKHQIDTIVSKNSGGDATIAKIIAAQELGIKVVMVKRPQLPKGEQVNDVENALIWLRNLL